MPNNQNTQCPVCGHSVLSSTLMLDPDLQPLQVTLFQKINPNWQEGEPVCPHCFDAVLNTIHQAETQEERLNSQGHLSSNCR